MVKFEINALPEYQGWTIFVKVNTWETFVHNCFRLHNKSVYFKMGLRKMVNRRSCKDLHKNIIVEVDGKRIDLPPVEGIIILNILRSGRIHT